MDESVLYISISAVLLVVFLVSFILAVRGSTPAKYFLWVWAVLMLVTLPLSTTANFVTALPAALLLTLFVLLMVLGKLQTNVQLEVSHEETRRVLAESNRRIDEERRTISRRLHDEVNPMLVLCKRELERLETCVAGDPKASKILSSVQELISDAYSETRDIIKMSRIEVIDSIGFTAAVESLINHFTNFFDKPAIVLEHNLPKRPPLGEEQAVIAYKILREAIYNAIKHSNAKQITVSLNYIERLGRIDVVVIDDGVGVKPRAKTHSEISTGIGLIDMRERARVIDGNLKIQPACPGNEKRPGTKVSFSVSTLSS